MKFDEIFHIVSQVAKKEKISCLLIGGFAINYYKVTRQTLDVDFLITPEGFEKIKPVLKQAGYREEFVRDVFARLGHKEKDRMDLDFLFVDRETLRKMIRSGKKIKLAGEEFYIPSLEHLLALKLHAMKNNPNQRLFKDLPDVLNLIQLNRVDYKTRKFEKLCLKYADEKIYRAVMESLKSRA
jgi:predicted nucleotidyltransferase